MDISDVQVEAFTVAGGSRATNASGATSVGFEIESAIRPIEGLELIATAAYADATFDKYRNAPTPEGTSEDASGNRIPLSSKYTLSGAVQYRRRVGVEATLVGRIEAFYKGPMYFDALNRLREPGYGLVNARVGLQGRRWSAFLWTKNLFDTRYRTLGGDLGPPIGRFGFAGAPRTFGARLALSL